MDDENGKTEWTTSRKTGVGELGNVSCSCNLGME